METPTNFWPPYVGKEFIPSGQEQTLDFMTDPVYKQVLAENPELFWHPDYMTSPECPSRDFKFTENYQPIDMEESDQ